MLTTPEQKAEAEEAARKANARLGAIRDAERAIENRSLVGACFRYRNSYSCPEKPSDYWWQYSKVQRMDDEGHLYIISFEKDKDGHVTIRRDEHRYHMQGYQKITASDFNKAWRAMQKHITSINP